MKCIRNSGRNVFIKFCVFWEVESYNYIDTYLIYYRCPISMDDIRRVVEELYGQLGYEKPSMTFIESGGRGHSGIEDIVALIGILPEVTTIFKKYHGSKKGEEVEIQEVTPGDLDITGLLNGFVGWKYPGDMVVSEEDETTFRDNPDGVVLFDPIDGTKNFAEGGYNCCFAFCRLPLEDGKLDGGYALIWEPFNRVLTLGIDGVGVYVFGREQDNHKNVIANVNSFEEQKKKAVYGRKILGKVFDRVDYSISGSGSVESARCVAGDVDVFLRKNQKLWDFIPGAYINHLAGKDVFFHNRNEDVFPLDYDGLIDALNHSRKKDERKFECVTITPNIGVRENICRAYAELV